MGNNYFRFKQFTIYHDRSAFKVGTDGVLLGASVDISSARRILDIGTGTGLIALMLAQRSDAEIVAIEADRDSFLQACDNVNMSPWNKQIKVKNTDLQNFCKGSARFDLIVSNPPYYRGSLKSPDPRKSATRHNDSLSSTELLDGVLRLMEENGSFHLILPYVEGSLFIAEASSYNLFCNSILKIKPNLQSEVRRLILSFNTKKKNTTERFLTIERGQRHQFTDEYINLTKDFYLRF